MNSFAMLPVLVEKAKGSSCWLWVLTQVLSRTIPFNRPHGFGVAEIRDDYIRT